MNQADLDNWFVYHAPVGNQTQLYQEIREAGKFLAETIMRNCPPSADATVAIRRVREAVMIANAAIACGGK